MKLQNFLSVFFITFFSDISSTRVPQACVFHTIGGSISESEGVRFIRIREDAPLGQEVLLLRVYPQSTVYLRSAEGFDDHTFFSLTELNTTTIRISLSKSLDELVDQEVPRNLLKLRILCSSKHEPTNEASQMSITVYIEDVNDNTPQFLKTPYFVDVDESARPGTIIFDNIQAFDRDKPNTPNSEVYVTMSEPRPEQLSLDGNPYFALKSPHRPLLELKKELDFDNGVREFQIFLIARDRGTPPKHTNTTLIVRVNDVDDLPPKFTEGVYRTKINEFYPLTGIPIRVPLYFSPPIMAYDQDSLNATLVYDIISGNERKLFRANSNNGIIFLQKEIDLEEESLPGNTFVLQIEAHQKENPQSKAVARIEMEVLDLNDNVPEFETDFYNISIVENLPNGFSVLQTNAADRDQGENAEFEYKLIEEEGAIGAFDIDSRSGWITVQNQLLLDREIRKSILLEVQAIERNQPYNGGKDLIFYGHNSVRVDIALLDSNDNTPTFANGNLYEFRVSMSTQVGTQIGQLTAYDPDEGENGKLHYELQKPKDSGYIPFRIDPHNGTLYVSGPLRRGRIAVFVEAMDQPTNLAERRFSLAVITVEVYATIDDETIDFVGAPYEFWVGSYMPLGTSVGQVRTTSFDEADDEIMFDLLHSYSEGVPFAIEEKSGIITVIRELREFTRKIYYFETVANYLFVNHSRDLNFTRNSQHLPDPTLPTSPADIEDEGVLITNVTIYIVAPSESTTVPSTRLLMEEINMNVIEFHVEENLVGAVIGQLLYRNGIGSNDVGPFVMDASYKSNVTNKIGELSMSQQRRQRFGRRLKSDGSVQLHYIIANQQETLNKISITEDGTLITVTGLDREERDKYELTIIVEYSTGVISGAGIYQVNVMVDDVNDNAPNFNTPTFVGMITENSPIGTEIVVNQQILITDVDIGRNSKFHIIIQGEGSKRFLVQFMNTTIKAEENTTTILNSWDNINGQRYEDFKESYIQNAWFMPTKMRSASGPQFRVIFVGKTPIDREKDQIYNLTLIAVDSGGLSSYATLKVFVTDVNDNAPIFEKISIFKEANIEIREYTNDLEIYFVDTSHPTQNNSSPSVTVEATTYEYMIPGSPRLSSSPVYLNPFNASASFGAVRRRLKRSSATKCPHFAVFEDIPNGQRVLQVTATDEDSGKNGEVVYIATKEIVKRSPIEQTAHVKEKTVRYFALDKLSGELIVNYPLVANTEVFVNITANDVSGLSDNVCLRFTVIDVNNYAPIFKKSWYNYDIEEGEYNEYTIGEVTALDLDFGENANITFTISSQDIPFTISPSSGILKANGVLDRELKSKYKFHVIATDNALDILQRLSSTVEIEVNVLDVNDNSPEFIGNVETTASASANSNKSRPMYNAYLNRNTKPGTFVHQITAVDKDYVGNGNGLILFSLAHFPESPSLFQIDSRDGTITTVSTFRNYNDYEHFNLTVVASDFGSPARSSSAEVLINLQGEVFDDVPYSVTSESNVMSGSVLIHHYYEVEVIENNDAPLNILKVNLSSHQSTDLFRWSLVDERYEDLSADFEVDSSTGTLYALKSFNREDLDLYKLRISVNRITREGRNYAKLSYPIVDERVEGLQLNEFRLVVRILDENDNAPRFKGNGRPIICVIPSLATFGYPVTTVEATDSDLGINAEIRFKLLNEPARIFSIDELTGKIRLLAAIAGMNQRIYGFDVKATDRRGADDGRSSIANVFIYVIDESRQVRIVVAGKPADVEQRIDSLLALLSEVIQIEIHVRLMEPHSNDIEAQTTDVYIYAVDMRTNSIVDMEELHQSLARLEFDNLLMNYNRDNIESSSLPQIIELAEFGEMPRASQKPSSIISGVEIISITLMALVFAGAVMAALCFICIRQKRAGDWTEQEFPSSETGLTYAIAGNNLRLDVNDCSDHRRSAVQTTRTTTGSFRPESMCSSHESQLGNGSGVQQLLEMPIQHGSAKSSATLLSNDIRPREYIDVPYPKSISTSKSTSSRYKIADQEPLSSINLNYNKCQSINNLNRISKSFDTSMFSLHSSGHDSGVDFLSNREMYVTSHEILSMLQQHQKTAQQQKNSCQKRYLCGGSDALDSRRATTINEQQSLNFCANDSSDNYEDSLKDADQNKNFNNQQKSINHVISHRGGKRNARCHKLALLSPPVTSTPCTLHRVNTPKFDDAHCVRHSFSGIKDTLVHNSPTISLESRGHKLRNSMNDLEKRLQNLEQSFRRPLDFNKPT